MNPPLLSTLIIGAAVSILETYHFLRDGDAKTRVNEGKDPREVRGLARMVQVSPSVTITDLTVRGVAPGTYRATIREFGDLKNGVESTGSIWSALFGSEKSPSPASTPRGFLGTVEVGPDGSGSAFLQSKFQVWEVIGHAMALTRQDDSKGPLRNDENTVSGIIARSAGIWDNDKTVCSCTGKTLWEERADEVKKGMI